MSRPRAATSVATSTLTAPALKSLSARVRAALAQLRRDLERAVEAEEYELAAKLRDQIGALTDAEN